MRGFAKNIIFAFALWFVLPMAMYFPKFVIEGTVFPALCEWFPDVFENYSPVLEADEYAVQQAIIDILIAVLTLLIYSYVIIRYDNGRMEYMITQTEGFYKRRDGMRIYYPKYIYADLTVAIVVPLPFIIASAYVPEHIYDFIDPFFEYIFSFGRLFTEHLGIVGGAIVATFTVFLTRLLSGMKSIGVWQGIWLSEID